MKNICQKIIGTLLATIILVSTNISLAVTQSDINKQQQEQKANENKINEKKSQIDQVEEIKDSTLKLNTVSNSNLKYKENHLDVISLF